MSTDTASRSWGLEPGDAITPELTAMRLLGGGAAYEAWLAADDITYAATVVKVVRPDQVEDESTLTGLRREIDCLTAVNHPSVVRMLRAEPDGDRPLVVLEHLDGPRLSSLVRRYGPLQPQQYLPLAIEVASAIHYFGHLGLVHLDIKPSNVIMGAPAKLIDLSIMRPADEAAALTTPVGTDAWMAPEQADPGDRGVPTSASDVWGLGASLHFAVTGHKPFGEGDPAARDLHDQFPQLVLPAPALPDQTPASVVEVIHASLAPNPADRPLPAEIVDVLEPVLAAQPRGELTGKLRSALRR